MLGRALLKSAAAHRWGFPYADCAVCYSLGLGDRGDVALRCLFLVAGQAEDFAIPKLWLAAEAIRDIVVVMEAPNFEHAITAKPVSPRAFALAGGALEGFTLHWLGELAATHRPDLRARRSRLSGALCISLNWSMSGRPFDFHPMAIRAPPAAPRMSSKIAIAKSIWRSSV
jgi:hypothetical protein